MIDLKESEGEEDRELKHQIFEWSLALRALHSGMHRNVERRYLLLITRNDVTAFYISHPFKTTRSCSHGPELTQLAKERAPRTAPMAVQFQATVNPSSSPRHFSSVPPGWTSDKPGK